MALKDAGIEIVESKDFSGGWTRSRHPEGNESPDCLNVYSVDGKLLHLPGHTLLESGQVRQPTTPVSPIHLLTPHLSNYDLIAQTDDKIYRIQNVTSPFNLVPSDATGVVPINPPDHHPSAVHYNDNLYCVDTNNPIWTIGTLGNATTVTTDIQSAYCLGVFKDRLVACGCKIAGTWFDTTVCYSASNDASSFDIAYDRWELETDKKEYCVHASQFGDAFYIYKTKSISKISGFPPYDWTTDRAYINGIGPVGRDCVKRGYLNMKGQAVEVDFFISYQGLYAFDGTNLLQLPYGKTKDYFRTFWRDIVWDSVGPHKVCAVFDEDNGLYKCWFTEGTFDQGSTNIRGIVYDAINNVIWPIDSESMPTTAAFAVVPSDISDLHHHIIHGHTDGSITRETTLSSYEHKGANLITNGDMEDDSDWTDYLPGGAGAITNERSSTDVYNGTYSRHLELTGGASVGGCSQAFTTEVGKAYRIYGRVKASAAGVANVLIQDGGGTLLTITPNDSPPWQDFSGTFVARRTSTTIILRIITDGTEAWFDAVQCFELYRNVFYKSELADLGQSFSKKMIKEMGIEHNVATTTYPDSSSFTVSMSYDDGASTSSTITISQAPTGTEKSKISSCTTSTAGIVGKEFRRCQATITLATTACTAPSWEISTILMAFNPMSQTFVKNT